MFNILSTHYPKFIKRNYTGNLKRWEYQSWYLDERERILSSTFSIISSLLLGLSLSHNSYDMRKWFVQTISSVPVGCVTGNMCIQNTLEYWDAAWDRCTSDYGSKWKYDMHFDARILPFQIHNPMYSSSFPHQTAPLTSSAITKNRITFNSHKNISNYWQRIFIPWIDVRLHFIAIHWIYPPCFKPIRVWERGNPS